MPRICRELMAQRPDWMKLEHTPGVAELAVIVSDAFQRRGIGALLMEQMVEFAKAEKVTRIIGTVLFENRPMRKLFERFGFAVKQGVDRETLEAELELVLG